MTDLDARQRGRSVTSKVVAILDAFSADTPRLSLQGLAERTGLPQSTTYRLACELVEWGGLERGSGGYQIGLRLWEIGELARRGEQLRDIAVPFMQDLYDATRENVHLAVLDGHEALYIEKITGRRATRVVTRRGGRLPLHATGVGKVLLAYAPGRARRQCDFAWSEALHPAYDRRPGPAATQTVRGAAERSGVCQRGDVPGLCFSCGSDTFGPRHRGGRAGARRPVKPQGYSAAGAGCARDGQFVVANTSAAGVRTDRAATPPEPRYRLPVTGSLTSRFGGHSRWTEVISR